MYALMRQFLFHLEPEVAHALVLSSLRYIPSWFFKKSEHKPVRALGLEFPHAVGLAAGLDKDGIYIDALAKLGFAFIELGTVTPRMQSGNSRPRVFRIPKARALINRMGFANCGVEALVEHVKRAQYIGIVGINIGKNKDTSLANAAIDYVYCLEKIYSIASYVTINISSPNTPGLRDLQQREYFAALMQAILEARERLTIQHKRHVPLLVKFSPDESDDVLKNMAEIVLQLGIEGIIVSNTTSARFGVAGLQHSEEAGGLSGAPLFDLSTRCLRVVRSVVGDAVVLVGVGGVNDALSAREKINAGAQLLQVYTGLIYKGPGLAREIVAGI